MTKAEFNFWWSRQQSSKGRWVCDPVVSVNSRMAARRGHPVSGYSLFFKGGEDGAYIEIHDDGFVEVGVYEGAVPHIGEALFTRKHKNQPMTDQGHRAGNFSEALGAISVRLGLGLQLHDAQVEAVGQVEVA